MRPFASANTMLPVLLAAACAGGPAADSTGANTTPSATPAVASATTPSPTESPPPTCDDWRNRNFFSSASLELVRDCLQGGVDPRAPVGYAPVIFSAARTATDPGVITLLTEAGADPNIHLGGLRGDYERGYTPLHAAAAYNPNPGIVTALVAVGADLDARDDEGGTPLHAAWGNRATVEELLRAGADPLARDERGRVADPTSCGNWNTPAFWRLALVGEFELCVGLGEDVSARDGDGNTPLHLAAQAENLPAVTFLLEAGADVNAGNNIGATPLHGAVVNEGPEVVAALLEAGADINDGAASHGTPLLHALALASRWGWSPRWEISEAPINALLEAGADVNASDSAGHTPLLASFELRRREGTLANLPLRLLAAGADATLRDSQGRTPLHVAAAAEGPEVVRALLQTGADPRAVDADGASPLHAAAASGSLEVIHLLISAGANPVARADDSRAPLHLAVRPPGSLSARTEDAPWTLRAFALLDAGADPNARTDEGDTPLHLHVTGSRPDTALVSRLVRAGADVNARNDGGETPLRLARARNRFPLVRSLIELGADPEDDVRIVDPGCTWEPRGDALRGASFLANAPVESVRGCLETGTLADARDAQGATHLARMVSNLACCVDFESVLREFVAAGADVNARDDEGMTVLHRAFTMAGRVVPDWVLNDVTAALLDAGADPNARDSAGSTLLHSAAGRRGLSREVSLLVAAGADVNERNSAGETPLHMALRRDQAATVRALLQLGADPAVRDSAGNTANPLDCERWGSRSFFALAGADVVAGCIAGGADAATARVLGNAVSWTRDPAVVSLLLEAGADVRVSAGLYTPLQQAAQSGTVEVVRTMLEAGADANAWATGFNVDYGWNWTALHLASQSNPDPEVVAALLEAGADLGALGGAGHRAPAYSPLHYAGANPNPAVAAALLDAGADVNALSPSGRAPLHEAAANASNPAVVELLVASGADVNARDANGYTPMHSAAWYNRHPEVMAALIAAGADLDARDPDGYVPPSGGTANHRTPLLMAVYRGGGYVGSGPTYTKFNAPVVEVLVRAGADLTLTDEAGRTALHEAARWHPALFPLLLRLGADPTVPDADGSTPLDYAMRNPSLQGLPEVRRLREALWRGRAGR